VAFFSCDEVVQQHIYSIQKSSDRRGRSLTAIIVGLWPVWFFEGSSKVLRGSFRRRRVQTGTAGCQEENSAYYKRGPYINWDNHFAARVFCRSVQRSTNRVPVVW
jgi:hypothetical protein